MQVQTHPSFATMAAATAAAGGILVNALPGQPTTHQHQQTAFAPPMSALAAPTTTQFIQVLTPQGQVQLVPAAAIASAVQPQQNIAAPTTEEQQHAAATASTVSQHHHHQLQQQILEQHQQQQALMAGLMPQQPQIVQVPGGFALINPAAALQPTLIQNGQMIALAAPQPQPTFINTADPSTILMAGAQANQYVQIVTPQGIQLVPAAALAAATQPQQQPIAIQTAAVPQQLPPGFQQHQSLDPTTSTNLTVSQQVPQPAVMAPLPPPPTPQPAPVIQTSAVGFAAQLHQRLPQPPAISKPLPQASEGTQHYVRQIILREEQAILSERKEQLRRNGTTITKTTVGNRVVQIKQIAPPLVAIEPTSVTINATSSTNSRILTSDSEDDSIHSDNSAATVLSTQSSIRQVSSTTPAITPKPIAPRPSPAPTTTLQYVFTTIDEDSNAPPLPPTAASSPGSQEPESTTQNVNLNSLAKASIAETISQTNAAIVDGVNLEEIKEFAKQFKLRRLQLGLTQTQVGQALSATEGPSYSQSAICRFEKLDITPKSAQKIKPVLENWMEEAEKSLGSGNVSVSEFIGVETNKKRKRRTSFTPAALDHLNTYFESNTHPSGNEMNVLAEQLNYEREVIRVWFCNKRQALRNTIKKIENDGSAS